MMFKIKKYIPDIVVAIILIAGAVALTISAQPLFLCKKLQPGFEKSGCWCKI